MPARPRSRRQPRIGALIVGADSADRRLLRTLIRSQPEVVERAKAVDRETALAALARRNVSLVLIAGLTDTMARELARETARQYPRVAVVIASDGMKRGPLDRRREGGQPGPVTIVPTALDQRDLAAHVYRSRHRYGPISGGEHSGKYVPLGRLIRAARLLRGWSHEDLNMRMGYSPTGLSKVESGERRPSDRIIAALEHHLGFRGDTLKNLADELDGRSLIHRIIAEQQRDLLDRLRVMDPNWALSDANLVAELLREHQYEARKKAIDSITTLTADSSVRTIVETVTKDFLSDSTADPWLFLRLTLIASGAATRTLAPLGAFFDSVAADFKAVFQLVLDREQRRYRRDIVPTGVARAVAGLAEGAALQFAVASPKARQELAKAFADVILALYECLTEPVSQKDEGDAQGESGR